MNFKRKFQRLLARVTTWRRTDIHVASGLWNTSVAAVFPPPLCYWVPSLSYKCPNLKARRISPAAVLK